jgi:hypothetical protein
MKILTWVIVLIILIGGGWYLWTNISAPTQTTPVTTATSTTPADTYGMVEYTDPTYGFSFWYPSALTVTASTTNDTTSFPGGTEVERLNVGPQGSTYIAVVSSPESTITDEPNGHASPIPQTKYFYDVSSGQWMVAYPEGTDNSGPSATTTANTSTETVGGLPLLQSGARFDTKVIPLSTTLFLVIGDGGGSFITGPLQQSVSLSSVAVNVAALEAVLQAESSAYNSSNQ